MRCYQCNAELPDGSAFCGECGAKQPAAPAAPPAPRYQAPDYGAPPVQNYGASPAPSYQAPNYGAPPAPGYYGVPAAGYGSPAPAPKKKKLLPIIIAAAAALVVVVALILVFTGGGPESVAEKFYNSIADDDMDAFVDCFQPDYYEENKTYMEAGFKTSALFLKEYENFSVKVLSSEELDDDELEDYQEEYKEKYKLEVTEGCEVRLKLSWEDDGEEKTEKDTLTVLKIDGDWYISE